MHNNIEYIRIKSNTSKKLLSKLLNVSVYTYNGYITNRLIIPIEILALFSKLYNIPLESLFCSQYEIPTDTMCQIKSLTTLSDLEKERYFTKNLTGGKILKLTYHNINAIKKELSYNVNESKENFDK